MSAHQLNRSSQWRWEYVEILVLNTILGAGDLRGKGVWLWWPEILQTGEFRTARLAETPHLSREP